MASSAEEEELQPLLERAAVADLVEHKASSDDAERSKADPDIVLTGLRGLGLSPNEAVMVGDAPYGVEAATRPGFQSDPCAAGAGTTRP